MRSIGHWFVLFLAAMTAPAQALDGASANSSPAVARIDAALETITTTVRPGRVGYATVWDGNKYIQCRRLADKAMRCEAAGAAMQPSLATVLDAPHVKRLAALGWTLEKNFGNYVRVFPAATPAKEIAALIVRTLAEAYGSDPVDLERQTTWVEDVPCPPRNGLSQNLAGLVNDDPEMVRIRVCSYTPDAAAPEKAASAAALVARLGATAAAEIERLRDNAQQHVFVLFDTGLGYVQCAPEMSGAIYCEAQSPQSWPELASVITPERLARLHALGYADPGRAPNYWKTYAAGQYTAAQIGAEILTVLYDVYGYSGATPLDIKTE